MEEILASIRRIIADEDTGKAAKPAAAPPAPPPPKPAPAPPPVAVKPPPPPPPPKPTNNQADVDAMLASMDAAPKPAPKPPEAVTPPPAPPPPAPPVADVLDLTEAMAAPPPAAPAQSFRRIDAASDVVFAEGSSEPTEPPPVSPAPAFDRGLMSSATRSAVDNAFHSLANTVLGNNARTLEDLVKEMLRPMLKNWLDDNLPGMVERIVRAEIERVSRGR